jgi:hypothetical protein
MPHERRGGPRSGTAGQARAGPVDGRGQVTSTSRPLTPKNLSLFRPEVATPDYDRGQLRVGVVHIGVGGFHRAHQAMYLDRLMNQGKALDWAICGVGVLPSDRHMAEVMAAQDGLYTLIVKHPDGALEPRVVGSIVDHLFAPDEAEAVIERMADPDTNRLADDHRGRLQHSRGDRPLRRGRRRRPARPPARSRPSDVVRPRHGGTGASPRPRSRAVRDRLLRQHPGQRWGGPEQLLGLRRLARP